MTSDRNPAYLRMIQTLNAWHRAIDQGSADEIRRRYNAFRKADQQYNRLLNQHRKDSTNAYTYHDN